MKNNIYRFLCIVCLLTVAVFAQKQTRGFKPIEITNERGEKFTVYENSFALVVGVNRFADSQIPPLNYATEDAVAISDLLQQMGFPKENIKMLTNEQATLQNVKEEFAALGAKTSRNDRLLVYWAGHGETEKLPRGGELGYLIPYDASLRSLYSTALSMDEVRRLSDRVAAKHILFLVDACYSGIAAVQSRALPKESKDYLEKVTSSEAVQIITAGTKDEQVVESSTWGHSAFAKAIIDGFQTKVVDVDNNLIVTTDELYSYLAPKVYALSRSEGTKGHRPVLASLRASEGQFAFVLPSVDVNFTITGLPAKNIVFVNGQKVSENSPSVMKQLRKGKYELMIQAQGYQPYTASIDLTEDKTLTPKLIATPTLEVLSPDESAKPQVEKKPPPRQSTPPPNRTNVGGFGKKK